MRAKIALLSRMVFRVDKDRIVRTRGHTRLTSDADRLVEIDNAVGALEHSSRWTRRDAWCMRALIAPRYLMSSSRLRELAYINVLDVSASYGERNVIFGLASRCTRVTANTARVVNYLCPLNRLGLERMDWELSHQLCWIAKGLNFLVES